MDGDGEIRDRENDEKPSLKNVCTSNRDDLFGLIFSDHKVSIRIGHQCGFL